MESLLRRWCLPNPNELGLESHVFPETISNFGIVTESGNSVPVTKGIRPHSTIPQIRQIVGNSVFEDYLKITIVRNPYDRVVSMFWWHLAQNNLSRKQTLESAPKTDIRRALGKWLNSESNFLKWAHLEKFANPALLGPNSLALRFEDLDNQCNLMLDQLGIPPSYRTLPSHKRGVRPQRPNTGEYFNWSNSSKVIARFHWEFRKLDYPLSIPPER